jgi:hypothetical protein
MKVVSLASMEEMLVLFLILIGNLILRLPLGLAGPPRRTGGRWVWGEGDTSWPFPCSFRTLGGPLSTRPNPLSVNSHVHVIRALYHRFRQGQVRISSN